MTTLLIAILLAPVTFAQSPFEVTRSECPTEVDFTARMGRVRDQGASNNCFAHVAADLLGFAQGVSPDAPISTLDVYSSYLNQDPTQMLRAAEATDNWEMADLFRREAMKPELRERLKDRDAFLGHVEGNGGAFMYAVAAYSNRGGYCTERQLPSEGPRAFISADTYFIRSVRGSMHFGYGMPLNITPSTYFSYLQCLKSDPLESFLRDGQQVQGTIVADLERQVAQKCAPRKPMKPYNFDYKSFDRGPGAPTALIIAKVLREGFPVGVGYDTGFLKLGNSAAQAEDNHISSIVAARWDESRGTCEFKIRNSWGGTCDGYHADYRGRCEGGHVWVDADVINERVAGIYAVNPRSEQTEP